MMFPSSADIKPRLRAFFSSRLVIVEAGQSPGAGVAVETSGASTVAETSDAPFFDAPDVTLTVTPLVAAPTVVVRFFFFTILENAWESEENQRMAAAAAR
jgi:hypothetical protein